jgi:hypothetical protein
VSKKPVAKKAPAKVAAAPKKPVPKKAPATVKAASKKPVPKQALAKKAGGKAIVRKRASA